MQTQKWVNLGYLISAGLLFLFFSRLNGFIWAATRLPRFEEGPVTLDVAVAFLIAIALALWARMWNTANLFFNEVVVELSKVTWPLRKETVASSGIVALLVGIAALLLTLMDLIWGTMARGIFRF